MSDHMDGLGEKIFITKGPLLNFWLAPIALPHPHASKKTTTIYPGNEWRFQAQKSTCLIDGSVGKDRHDWVVEASTAKEAKRRGQSLKINAREWDARAYGDMLEANVAKFVQHPDLGEQLLATGFATLIEHRPDPIWGDGDGTGILGKNLQGRILMRVRAQIRPLGLTEAELHRIKELLEREGYGYDADVKDYLRLAEEALVIFGVQNPIAIELLKLAKVA